MSSPLAFFPARIAIGQFTTPSGQAMKVQMTPEFYRALQEVLVRIGGPASDASGIEQLFLDAVTAPFGLAGEGREEAAIYAPFCIEAGMPGLDLMQSPMPGTPLPIMTIVPTASPMSITADRRCAIHIDGGTVAGLVLSRFGVSLDVAGAKLVELSIGDTLTITYSAAPDISLIPRD